MNAEVRRTLLGCAITISDRWFDASSPLPSGVQPYGRRNSNLAGLASAPGLLEAVPPYAPAGSRSPYGFGDYRVKETRVTRASVLCEPTREPEERESLRACKVARS
jgi:hypothetical protein